LDVLAYNSNHVEIPDSLADACVSAMLRYNVIFPDTSFEKIFRESYQLWQELDHDDLTDKIVLCFTLVNDIEAYCQTSSRALCQKLDDTDFNGTLWSGDSHAVTDILVHNQRLHYFMGMRYNETKATANEVKYLHEIIAEIDSMCLALGYGTYKVSESFTITP
jgi:hypothetical protein